MVRFRGTHNVGNSFNKQVRDEWLWGKLVGKTGWSHETSCHMLELEIEWVCISKLEMRSLGFYGNFELRGILNLFLIQKCYEIPSSMGIQIAGNSIENYWKFDLRFLRLNRNFKFPGISNVFLIQKCYEIPSPMGIQNRRKLDRKLLKIWPKIPQT